MQKKTSEILASALALLMFFLCILPASVSADTVYLKVVRYDGVSDGLLYDPCTASYGIEVVGAPEDAEITYEWQVNVAGIVGDHDWLKASDCTWVRNPYAPTVTVSIREGYNATTVENRFVLRCLVKVDGKKYYSTDFQIVSYPSNYYDVVRVVDARVPELGKTPVQVARFTTSHLKAENCEWLVQNTTGIYRKMTEDEVFQKNKTYAVRFYARMDDGWFVDPDKTTATVNGSAARVLTKHGDSRLLYVMAEYYMDSASATPLVYDGDLADLLKFAYGDMDPLPAEYEKTEMYVGMTEGSSYTFKFPYVPLPGAATADGYSVACNWILTENGGTKKSGSGTSATLSGLTAGKNYDLTARLRLLKDGGSTPSPKTDFVFHISVAKQDDPPVITSQPRSVVPYTDGDTVVLHFSASGQNLKYLWMKYDLHYSKIGDPYYAWQPVYSPDGSTLALHNVGASDDGVLYRCRVTNGSGIQVLTSETMLVRVGYALDSAQFVTDALFENGKTASPSAMSQNEGVSNVDAELFLASDPASAATASDYMAFASNVVKQYPGSEIQTSKKYYLGLSVTAAEGYRFSDGLSATVNGKEAKILSLDETVFYCVVEVEAPEQASFLKGDVNGDGRVDSRDYMLLKRYVLKTATLTEEQKSRANVDGRNGINASDYMYLKRLVLKK